MLYIRAHWRISMANSIFITCIHKNIMTASQSVNYREIIEHEPARILRKNYIHPPLIIRVYAERSPLHYLHDVIAYYIYY